MHSGILFQTELLRHVINACPIKTYEELQRTSPTEPKLNPSGMSTTPPGTSGFSHSEKQHQSRYQNGVLKSIFASYYLRRNRGYYYCMYYLTNDLNIGNKDKNILA